MTVANSVKSLETGNGSDKECMPGMSRDDANNVVIRQLPDLNSVADDKYDDVFMRSLNTIYQYSLRDIQDQLQKASMKVLTVLHKALCDKVRTDFSQYKDRRAINRQVKHTIVPDIFNLGYSLVNKSQSNELDKIFVNKDESLAADTDSDMAALSVSEYQELLQVVADLTQRLTYLESKVKTFQREGCKLVSEKDIGTSPLKPLRTSDLSDNDSPDTNTDGDTDLSTDHEDNVRDNNEKQNEPFEYQGAYRRKLNRRRKRQPNTTTIDTASSKHTTKNAVSIPTKSHKVIASASRPKKSVYVGNIDVSHSADDIRGHPKGINVTHGVTVTDLARRRDWRSFKVEVPADKLQAVLDKESWSQGVIVRPFRDQENSRRQGNPWKQKNTSRMIKAAPSFNRPQRPTVSYQKHSPEQQPDIRQQLRNEDYHYNTPWAAPEPWQLRRQHGVNLEPPQWRSDHFNYRNVSRDEYRDHRGVNHAVTRPSTMYIPGGW